MLLGTLDSSSELILLASMETLYFPMALMRVTCIQDCIRKVQPARAVMGWERGLVRGLWWTIGLLGVGMADGNGSEGDLPGGEGGDLGRVWKTLLLRGGRQGRWVGRWYNEGNESFMVAVWLSLVYKLFSSSQKHKKRRISSQKLRTNVYFEIQHIIEFISVHLRFFLPPSPPLQLIFPRQFLKRVVGFTSTNEQGSGTLPHPEHQTFFFPTMMGLFLCSASSPSSFYTS